MGRHALRKRAWALAIERRTLRRTAAVHLLFREEQQGLHQLRVDRPLVVATNGIDAPPDVAWDGGSDGYLLFLGRYDPVHKGLDLLLRGLATLPPHDRPTIQMHGPDWQGGRAEVRTLVDELGLAAWVYVGDAVPAEAKWDLLARARGMVLTSRWEAAPVGLAEAASIGLPALVTDYPMGRWMAGEGAAVLADRDPAGIARGLHELSSSDAAEVGGRARALAESSMSWSAVARSWLEQVRRLDLGS